ncbi:hypothetical protein ACJX0J_010353 [Zea mays]
MIDSQNRASSSIVSTKINITKVGQKHLARQSYQKYKHIAMLIGVYYPSSLLGPQVQATIPSLLRISYCVSYIISYIRVIHALLILMWYANNINMLKKRYLNMTLQITMAFVVHFLHVTRDLHLLLDYKEIYMRNFFILSGYGLDPTFLRFEYRGLGSFLISDAMNIVALLTINLDYLGEMTLLDQEELRIYIYIK